MVWVGVFWAGVGVVGVGSLTVSYQFRKFPNYIIIKQELIYRMLTSNNLQIDDALFLQFQNFAFHLPNFLGYKQPLTPIVLQNQKKPRSNPSGEEEGKGKWTKLEQKAYIEYLQNNKDEMSSKLSRKSQKVFLKMSFLVKTRTADQCRSHHQKILKYNGTIDDIVKHYSQERNFCMVQTEGLGFDKKYEKRTGDVEQIFTQNQIFKIERKENKFRILIRTEQIRSFDS